MNKSQAFHQYVSSFGLTAYDQETVPTGEYAPNLPYITYAFSENDFVGNAVPLSISVWYRSTSWEQTLTKANEIIDDISMGGKMIPYDGGALWLKRGVPMIQRMTDDSDDMIRRALINIEAEFISE